MRLVEGWEGFLYDLDECRKCCICDEWFLKDDVIRSYCRRCRKDYQRWRSHLLRREEKYSTVEDTSIPTFRDKYLSGLLQGHNIVPWTWPGENEIPPGAVCYFGS